MEATQATQLKADLSMIGNTIGRAEVPEATKVLFRELLEWNKALVDVAGELAARVDASEAAIEEILQGDGEMLFPETAAQITQAFDHNTLLGQATLALIEGPAGQAIDEMSKKRFRQLIENAQRANALAAQIVNGLIASDDDAEDDDEEDDDGHGDDGLGDGSAGAADADAEDGDEEEGAHGA